jgi:hypothetical protein
MTDVEQTECSIVELVDRKAKFKSMKERDEMISNLCNQMMKFLGKGIDVTVEQLYNMNYEGEH